MGARNLEGKNGVKPYALFLALWLASVGAQGAWGQVTYERLRKATQKPHNWFTYSGDYTGQRYSLLKRSHAGNVEQLAVQWVFQTRTPDKFETTPLVIDGIMYLSGPGGRAYALDARTGGLLWRYHGKNRAAANLEPPASSFMPRNRCVSAAGGVLSCRQ